MLDVTWVAIGVLAVSNGVFAFQAHKKYKQVNDRYEKNESKDIGKLEGKMDGVIISMGSLERRVNTMETNIGNRLNSIDERLDKFFSDYPGNVTDG